ncbi:glycosyltransferase family 2 protein [bacterium]|nr:glycosyltransferase family 2 protein [bacterium]
MIPVVSVCITAYNHEEYIEECVNSVLSQVTSFPFEIIIGEDASKDKTAQICDDLQKMHPDKVRVFHRSDADKVFIAGRKTGRFNFCENLREASGEYIALLDGDDYWLDTQKLQKQYDFASGSKLKGVYGSYLIKEKTGLHKPEWPFKQPVISKTIIVDPGQIMDRHFHFSHTSTCFFHRGMVPVILNNPIIYKSFGADELIMLELFNKGKVGFINEPLSVYRNDNVSTTNWKRTYEARCENYYLKLTNFKLYKERYPFFRKNINYKINFIGIHLINSDKVNAIEALKALFYFVLRFDRYFTVKGAKAFYKRLKGDTSL